MYTNDNDFGDIYDACKKMAIGKYCISNCYLLYLDKFCIPNDSLRELLVTESHGGGLMEHVGVAKTLGVLQGHFHWPCMRKDVERSVERCVTCR